MKKQKIKDFLKKDSCFKDSLQCVYDSKGSNPDFAVIKSRLVLECLLKDVYKKEFKTELPPDSTNDSLTKALLSKKVIEKIILNEMNYVRIAGNDATHNSNTIKFNKEDSTRILSSLLIVVGWYFDKYDPITPVSILEKTTSFFKQKLVIKIGIPVTLIFCTTFVLVKVLTKTNITTDKNGTSIDTNAKTNENEKIKSSSTKSNVNDSVSLPNGNIQDGGNKTTDTFITPRPGKSKPKNFGRSRRSIQRSGHIIKSGR